jgi:hypothetical protein
MMGVDQIPAEYVDKYFTMDPETDDLLSSGRELVPGMIVLLEGTNFRIDISDGIESLDAGDRYSVDKYNRWVYVLSPSIDHESNMVIFVARYADGTKRQIHVSLNHAWFVKKDSKPYRPSDASHWVQNANRCDHPIDMFAPHCAVLECPNYAGRFGR